MSREFEPEPMPVQATEFGEVERHRLYLLAGLAAGLTMPPAILLAHRLGLFELPGPYLEVGPLPKPSSVRTFGDLHVHTAKSPDVAKHAKYTMEEVFDRAPEKGVKIIAFTEHNICYNYDESQRAADEAGLILIPALESLTFNPQGWEPFASKIFQSEKMSSVHLLGLGVTEPIAAPGERLSIQEAVERIHQQNGLAIIAHPSMAGIDWYSRVGKELIRKLGIDGVEVLNALIPHFMNEAAEILANELGLPVTGGSDAKQLVDFGRGLTVFTTDTAINNWQECLEAIKQGRTSTRGRGVSLASFLLYLLSY